MLWQNRYATTNQDELEGIAPLVNGGALAVGRSYNAGRGADAWWLYLDSTGAIVSQTTFGDTGDETIHAVTRRISGAVLVGQHAVAMSQSPRALAIALDATGAVRWSHLLQPAGATTSSLTAVTTLASGDVLAVGQSDNNAWFVEFDDTNSQR